MLLVNGGQANTRDKRVVELVAQKLFDRLANRLTIITGGALGIPMDFARAWLAAGGKHVKFVVWDEYLDTLDNVEMGVEYNCGYKTQAESRRALMQWPGLTAALIAQGDDDEIRGVPTTVWFSVGEAEADPEEVAAQIVETLIRHFH